MKFFLLLALILNISISGCQNNEPELTEKFFVEKEKVPKENRVSIVAPNYLLVATVAANFVDTNEAISDSSNIRYKITIDRLTEKNCNKPLDTEGVFGLGLELAQINDSTSDMKILDWVRKLHYTDVDSNNHIFIHSCNSKIIKEVTIEPSDSRILNFYKLEDYDSTSNPILFWNEESTVLTFRYASGKVIINL